ncbi:MAG: PEGA domain-containing protein [Polyangiaceae bacterium]|nr:PEGA domain-containing protein [Polyangiaceae bacterium]
MAEGRAGEADRQGCHFERGILNMMGSRRRMQWGGLALMAALAGIGMRPGEALAQSSKGDTSVDSARSKEATARFREGTKAADAGLWEKARLAFASAWELKQHWQIAAHLGRAELQTGHNREAAEHLTYFLREATGVPEADLKKSRAMLDQALSKVASVTVRVNVEGAEVFVDGRSAGRSPISGVIYVDPGRRTFEAKREGYATATATEEMKAGSKPTLELSLEKSTTEITAIPSATTSSSASASDRLTTRTIVLGSAAGALLIGGIALAIASEITSDERDKYDKNKTFDNPDRFRELEGQRLALARTSFYSFIGLGLATGATVASVMIDLAGTSKSSTKAAVQATTDGLGIRVVTRW